MHKLDIKTKLKYKNNIIHIEEKELLFENEEKARQMQKEIMQEIARKENVKIEPDKNKTENL